MSKILPDYFAHTSTDGRRQLLTDHLQNVGDLAADFARAFHSADFARLPARMHDVGKSSPGFYRRLFSNGPKVDHSTLGAQLLYQRNMEALAYICAGHHGGLLDYGTTISINSACLAKRLQKKVDPCPPELLAWLGSDPLPDIPLQVQRGNITFALAFWIRMLFSCVVDADRLDTQAFMEPHALERGRFSSIGAMASYCERHIQQFSQPGTHVHRIRNQILNDCRQAAGSAPGLYSLTVPTGGGKTISSLSFALTHAARHGLRRVIYCLPYTSILEQNAKVFENIVGKQNVLTHYADALADLDPESDDDDAKRKALAIENWDHPLIVTTNVQFLESLFAHKTSKCRKLHRLARSVIVMDEAQMLPRDYLTPCVAALTELCRNYGCTVLLMSATQPALNDLFTQDVRPKELNRQVRNTFDALRRVQIQHLGEMSMPCVAQRISEHHQALCIVNSKRAARELYDLLPCEGRFHLSTRMLPEDRRLALDEIRQRLKDGLPCRVAATSLVEAGVDLDFPVAYRQEAGLDSILQAAGRVNREGARHLEDSFLYVFRVADMRMPLEVRTLAAATQRIFTEYDDVTTEQAIEAYFRRVYMIVGAQQLDKHGIMDLLDDEYGTQIPFATISDLFRIIDADTRMVVIPSCDDARKLAAQLKAGEMSVALLREAGRHSVNVWPYELEALTMSGSVHILGEDNRLCILTRENLYNPSYGLTIPEAKGGQAMFDS